MLNLPRLGPRYHIADILIEEFKRVTDGKLRVLTLLEVVEPFMRLLDRLPDDAAFNRISKSVILALINHFPVSDGDKELPLHRILLETMQYNIFAMASSEGTLELNRPKLYALHKEYQKATQRDFIEELPQIVEEVVPKTDLPKKKPIESKASSKKRKLHLSIPPLNEGSSNVLHEGKGKKTANGEKDFIPAKSFEGSKFGFVFKKDSKGLGYYRDSFQVSIPPTSGKLKKTVRFGQAKAKAYSESVSSLRRSPVDLKSTPSRSSLKKVVNKEKKISNS